MIHRFVMVFDTSDSWIAPGGEKSSPFLICVWTIFKEFYTNYARVILEILN